MAASCTAPVDPSWSPVFTDTAGRRMSDTEVRDEHPEWSRLMAAAQDGDAEAYRHLLTAITPLLRRVAARRLSGAPAADIEDVVQDVLLSVHAVRHTYDPARPFLPWLMAIERHRIADAMRRWVRRGKNEVAVESLEETFADRAANTEDEEPIDRQEINAAVAGLPPAQRRAIELLKLKEMSLKEAAKETGMSQSALKVASHRGMKALRALLGKERS
jgi:RNA polymerase sigma-70 factor (ECF subfamily)